MAKKNKSKSNPKTASKSAGKTTSKPSSKTSGKPQQPKTPRVSPMMPKAGTGSHSRYGCGGPLKK